MSSSPADLSAAAIKLAIETTANAIVVEQENAKLHEQLQKNLQLLGDFEIAAPRAQLLQKQLKEKEALLEQKRQELVEVQQSIISTLQNQSQAPIDQGQQSLAAIPTVMNHVQKLITDLTEEAVNQKTIAVPILSLFKAAGVINSLYETLSNNGIIQETQEEKQERINTFVSTQQDILTKLREVVQNVQESQLHDDEEEEEAEAGTDSHKPQVEEVTEQTPSENPPQTETTTPVETATQASSTEEATQPSSTEEATPLENPEQAEQK